MVKQWILSLKGMHLSFITLYYKRIQSLTLFECRPRPRLKPMFLQPLWGGGGLQIILIPIKHDTMWLKFTGNTGGSGSRHLGSLHHIFIKSLCDVMEIIMSSYWPTSK